MVGLLLIIVSWSIAPSIAENICDIFKIRPKHEPFILLVLRTVVVFVAFSAIFPDIISFSQSERSID